MRYVILFPYFSYFRINFVVEERRRRNTRSSSVKYSYCYALREHLTIDGYDGDKKKLNNKELVLRCLNELPGLLGMRKSLNRNWWCSRATTARTGGVSGVVLIAESHISIHIHRTPVPYRGCVHLQKRFGYRENSHVFQRYVRLTDIEKHFIKRGTRYPQRNLL